MMAYPWRRTLWWQAWSWIAKTSAGRGSRLCRLRRGHPAVYIKLAQPCPRFLLLPLLLIGAQGFTGDRLLEVDLRWLGLVLSRRLQEVGCFIILWSLKGLHPNEFTRNLRLINHGASATWKNQGFSGSSMPSLRKVPLIATWAPSATASIGGSIWAAMDERVGFMHLQLSSTAENGTS